MCNRIDGQVSTRSVPGSVKPRSPKGRESAGLSERRGLASWRCAEHRPQLGPFRAVIVLKQSPPPTLASPSVPTIIAYLPLTSPRALLWHPVKRSPPAARRRCRRAQGRPATPSRQVPARPRWRGGSWHSARRTVPRGQGFVRAIIDGAAGIVGDVAVGLPNLLRCLLHPHDVVDLDVLGIGVRLLGVMQPPIKWLYSAFNTRHGGTSEAPAAK